MRKNKKKILAVASKGGHLIQLMRLRPIFEEHITAYVSNYPTLDVEKYYCVEDANRNSTLKIFVLAAQILKIVIKEKPDVIITTGAAPGFFAVVFARLMGKKTVWIDSIANAEAMSLSGQKARRWAGLWLTQWSDLARKNGPYYKGGVL